MSNYTNNTDKELNDYIKYREEDIRKQRAKLQVFGKVLGEDKLENIVAMIQAMSDDVNTYTWLMSELDDLYEERNRRKQDNVESD